MNVDELIALSRDLAYSGKEYLEIKREIAANGASEEEMKAILRKADEFIVNYELASQKRAGILNQMIIGGAFLVVGLFAFAYTYLSGSTYTVPIAVILGGAWILRSNYRKYRQPIERLLPKPKETFKSKFQRF